MKVDVKKLPKSEVELTITVPHATYLKWEKKALEELGKKMKVDGFRAGHVPENVIREKLDDNALKATALDYVLPQTYSEAVKEKDLQVIAQPKVEIKSEVGKEGDDFVYVATVAVMPEVKMGDYKKIKVARKEVKVEDKKVDETLDLIMQRFAEWKDVDRAAKEGDRTEVSFEGFEPKGDAIPNTASKNHPVVLGSKTMVPGFEDAIMGMKKDEEKEFEVTFPKEYHAKAMQGKKVKFKLTLHRIEEKMEQKVDEAMIEKVSGKKQSVDEFKEDIRKNLTMEMEQKNRQEHDNAVVSEVIKITKAEIPEALIDQEVAAMMQDQKSRVAQQGLTWEQFLSHIKKSEDDFKKDHAKGAEERILARLGVQEIIKDAKIEVSEDEVKKRIEEMAAAYPEEQKKMVQDHYKKDEAFRLLKYNMAADKLIEMLTK